MNKIKVFLGGTCNNSTWRNKLIEILNIEYFNPVVKNWTPECMKEEIEQRNICDLCLYVITPKMTGVYSIAEVVDDSNKKSNKTLFCILYEDGEDKFTSSQWKSLVQVSEMVSKNGVHIFNNIEDIAKFLNNY